jgi:hypothetical protein
MKNLIVTALLAGCSISTLGCQFIARDPARYERDTRAVLEQNSGAIQQCYESHLRGDRTAAGTVVVKFHVAEETGLIQNVKVDSAASTAPAPLQECVAQSISGLKLTPADARTGHATFTYELAAAGS